jgi:hypothetical protein
MKPNEPFTYFIGAAWSGNRRFGAPGNWDALLRQEADWAKLTALYARAPTEL